MTEYIYHCWLCNEIIPDNEAALKAHREMHQQEKRAWDVSLEYGKRIIESLIQTKRCIMLYWDEEMWKGMACAGAIQLFFLLFVMSPEKAKFWRPAYPLSCRPDPLLIKKNEIDTEKGYCRMCRFYITNSVDKDRSKFMPAYCGNLNLTAKVFYPYPDLGTDRLCAAWERK